MNSLKQSINHSIINNTVMAKYQRFTKILVKKV